MSSVLGLLVTATRCVCVHEQCVRPSSHRHQVCVCMSSVLGCDCVQLWVPSYNLKLGNFHQHINWMLQGSPE